MPILVTCKCGKKFRADEKHTGKQRSCPKCGQALDITGPNVSAYDVFVSYSSKDKATCDALCATFEGKGLRCWIAPRDILPGMNWGEAIIEGIEQSRVMVLVFSSHSNQSSRVRREVERAVNKGIPVIPLRIEDVKLSLAMEYFISSQHWLDALTPPLEKHLEKLARKVIRLLTVDRSSNPPPGRNGSDPMSPLLPTSLPVDKRASGVGSLAKSTDPLKRWPRTLSSAARAPIWWSRIPLFWRWISVCGVASLFTLFVFNLLMSPVSKGSPTGDLAAMAINKRLNDGKSVAPLTAPFSETDASTARALWAAAEGVDPEFTNEVGMVMVLIPPSQFTTDRPALDTVRSNDGSQHSMTISQPYFMGVTEVTQKQWMAVMGTEPWKGEENVKTGDDYPAAYVNWDDAVEFCQRLSKQEGKAYRLPTESEWEYACRAGTVTAYSFGEDDSRLGDYAWFDRIALWTNNRYAHQVGQKLPNGFGLRDMHGNVWEWCQDWYGKDYYKSSPSVDPLGPSGGNMHILRGGSWDGNAGYCRAAFRICFANAAYSYGFRVVSEYRPDAAVVLDSAATSNKPPPNRGISAVALTAPFSESDALAARASWATAEAVEPEFTNELGMALVLIPPGQFEMGSPDSEKNRSNDEHPHTVKISQPYFLGVTEVTQGQWRAMIGTEPWKGETNVKEGNDYPATYVSWEAAVEFCQKLSRREGKTYRLPTEAEWEYACRGGTWSAYWFGDDDSRLGDYGWYDQNARNVDEKYPHPIGQKLPNSFGLQDMYGNVWEWCHDWHHLDYYENSPSVDPPGPPYATSHVIRGGSWFDPSFRCRSGSRNYDYDPSLRNVGFGFRVMCELR